MYDCVYLLKMSLDKSREAIAIAYSCDIIDTEEAILLFDINRSKNPEFPYWEYNSFDVNSLSEDEFLAALRFSNRDIDRLVAALGIPREIRTANGSKFSGIEGVCCLLKRPAYPCRYSDLLSEFGRSVPELSLLTTKTMNMIYERWHHLLSDLNQPLLSQRNLEMFSRQINEKGAPLTNCWGFIDGTVRPICRPKDNQRRVYNGHKRVHALKFQSVLTPNGLIANLFGPIEGRRHDARMLRESNLLTHLQQFSFNGNGQPLCLYGDPAYPISVHLLGPFQGKNLNPQQTDFNAAMSEVRESVEWGFGKVVNYFKFIDFKKNLKLQMSPVGNMYAAAVLLTNAHTCLYGSQTSEYFDT